MELGVVALFERTQHLDIRPLAVLVVLVHGVGELVQLRHNVVEALHIVVVALLCDAARVGAGEAARPRRLRAERVAHCLVAVALVLPLIELVQRVVLCVIAERVAVDDLIDKLVELFIVTARVARCTAESEL